MIGRLRALVLICCVFGFGAANPADAATCCVIADTTCNGTLSQVNCERDGNGVFTNDACGNVEFCKAVGRCEETNNPASCRITSRYQCNQLGGSYQFYLSQNCVSGSPDARTPEDVGESSQPTTPPLTFTPNVALPGFGESREVTPFLFGDYVGAFFVYFVGVAGILAVVTMMWGGYHYIVAAGNPQKMRQGKEIITNALIGLVLALTSFLLLRTVNPSLVSYGGFVPGFIKQVLQPFEEAAEPDKPNGSTVDVDPGSLQLIAQRVRNGGYQTIVSEEAGRQGIDRYRLMALLFIESSGDPKAMSTFKKKDGSDGHACGLIQLLPSTSQQYGGPRFCDDGGLFDPRQNIATAAKYYRDLVNDTCPEAPYSRTVAARTQCNPKTEADNPCKEPDDSFATAAYNAGKGANYCSQRCGGVTTIWQCERNSGYSETRRYVEKAELTYTWLKANFPF